MPHRVIVLILALQAAWCLLASGHAAGFSKGARGTTGAQFLELPVGARAIAMGSAQGAAVYDATALYYNPAALAGISGGDAIFMHSAYFQDISYDYLGVAQNLGEPGTVGVGAQYLSAGSVKEVRKDGTETGGSFTPSDLALTLGYGRTFETLELGGGLKYISSQLHGSARTFAFDLGARLTRGKLALSGTAANLGQGLKFRDKRDSLPTTIRLGSALELKRLALAFDVIAPRGVQPHFAVGAECFRNLSKNFWVAGRVGYNSRTEPSKLGGMTGLSLGAGIGVRRVNFDYAFVPFGDLGATHRLSAGWYWGGRSGGD